LSIQLIVYLTFILLTKSLFVSPSDKAMMNTRKKILVKYEI